MEIEINQWIRLLPIGDKIEFDVENESPCSGISELDYYFPLPIHYAFIFQIIVILS